MNKTPHFPLRLGSKEKRHSHTLRSPKPRNTECMTKRQTITWDPHCSVHVKGKEKSRDQQIPLLASGRGKMSTPLSLTTQTLVNSFSHFLPLYSVQSLFLSLFSHSCFPQDTKSADLTHQLWYPHLITLLRECSCILCIPLMFAPSLKNKTAFFDE